MSGPIVRTGTTPKYWENWDNVFGEKKTTRKKTTRKKPARKTAAKKAKKAKKTKKKK